MSENSSPCSSTKKVQRGSYRKHQNSISSQDEQKTISNSFTDIFQISFNHELNNHTKHDRHTMANKNEELVKSDQRKINASNRDDIDNIELSQRLAAILKIPSNSEVELKDEDHKRKSKNSKSSLNVTYKRRKLLANQIDTNNKLVKNKRSKSKTADNETIEETKETKKKKPRKPKNVFLNHIPVSDMQEILNNQDPNNIQYIKGTLRINYRYYKHAYLSMENECDLLIDGLCNRNRAFDGDVVVACINSNEEWCTFPDGQVQKTGKIVCILEKVHPRKAVGYLKQKDSSKVLLYPRDQRVPLIRIFPESLPQLYKDDPNGFKDTMISVKIKSWKEPSYASGSVVSIVGEMGDLDAELNAILLENDLDVLPYKKQLLKELPSKDYILTDADIKDREDWRHECIITIDPDNAVDLDDAISCKVLSNGNYEIGVHISDVTHYLKFFSPLDTEVSKRATTIYLAHTSYHMLPNELCHICSLLPGEDRLAFSVIWEMTPEAQIVTHRFAKTVLKSCCQISYNSAQEIIDNPGKTWPKHFLDIKGRHTVSSVSEIVNNLFKLTTQLRNKRFAEGALKLEQPKFNIRMDATFSKKHGIAIPVDYYLQEIKDSNMLIEELMLLANMTVATQLYIKIPNTALLRIHKNPSKHILCTIRDTLRKYGIDLNIETAKELHASIQRYENDGEYHFGSIHSSMKHIIMVIVNLCSKAMARAEYKCTSATSSLNDLKHYALNAQLYTHFTSPIRRYSDCVVHRLLHATLDNKPLSKRWTAKLCTKIASICNIKKQNAKLAQEQSIDVFFTYMVQHAGGFQSLAIVSEVKENNIDVILYDIGMKLRISLKEMQEQFSKLEYQADNVIPTICISWKKNNITQVINVFSMVDVKVQKHTELFRLKAILLPPKQ